MKLPKEDVLEKHAAVYAQLKQVRESKTLSLKPSSMLRTEVVGLDGEARPFRLRYYQVQAIFHLLAMRRMVLGDPTGCGKTLMVIGALCYMWEKEPDTKALVVCPKSALRQWAAEVEKFATGITVYVVDGTPNERKQTYLEFAVHEGPTKAILVLGYAPLVRDWNAGAGRPTLANGAPDTQAPIEPGTLDRITGLVKSKLCVIFDEATAFKSDRTKTWEVCRALSERATRCYGLTATVLKNNLMEGFSIFKCIYPPIFGTKTSFLKDYCYTKLQHVPGGRKVPIVVGYKNLDAFRGRIDPFFLGRPKHVISDELPKLTTREVLVRLSASEDAKYREALTGVLALGDGEVRDYEEHKALVALIYCQQAVDSLSLLRFEEGAKVALDVLDFEEEGCVGPTGSKEQALLDLLGEEFNGEKVIVYCRFASLIPRLQQLCATEGIVSVAVTGSVVDTAKNPARRRAQEAFQDPKSDVRVIFISDAGSEAINLQLASAMVFYNVPWSWGSYIQLLGRAIRIGSPHESVVAVHLVAERPGSQRKTIDHHTLAILQSKKQLIDKVLGEAAVGALNFDNQSFARELQRSLLVDSKRQ